MARKSTVSEKPMTGRWPEPADLVHAQRAHKAAQKVISASRLTANANIESYGVKRERPSVAVAQEIDDTLDRLGVSIDREIEKMDSLLSRLRRTLIAA